MRKADVSGFVYLAFVVIIGVLAIVIVFNNLNPLQSPEGRSLELATKIALYTDSLSTVEEGTVTILTGDYKYDIEIQEKDSNWRSIGKALLPKFIDKYIDKKGYYIAVTPYEKSRSIDDEKGDSAAFIISSYSIGENHNALFEGVSSICIVKESGNEFAEVKQCSGR